MDSSRLAVTDLSRVTGVPLFCFEHPQNNRTKHSDMQLCLRGRVIGTPYAQQSSGLQPHTGTLARSVFYLKCRTLLWPTLPAIIETRRRNVRMPQPLLHLGDVGVVRECIRGGCRTQGMHAEAVHVRVDADLFPVVAHNLLVDRVRMQ